MRSKDEQAKLPLEAPAQGVARGPRQTLLAAAILFGFAFAVFAGVFFAGGDTVVSEARCDIGLQYAAWRDFAFSQLRHGHFPLWNPHVYSGAPFFGGLQSGLLYPLNLPYLFLPLARAINFGVALHVFLAGLFMYLWARRRGLEFLPGLFCGVLWMFCGQHYFHVTAGHLTGLISTAWIPLLFLAVDGLFDNEAAAFTTKAPRHQERILGEENRTSFLGVLVPWWSWVLLGSMTICMMTFGGDPQYLFHTGVAAAIYSAFRLAKAEKRLRIVTGLAAMCAVGAALAAVQLLAGIETTAESVRGGHGVSYAFASIFSFPPENFLTLLAPGFFGPQVEAGFFQYWGRCFLWEMCLFIGVTGLLLAIYGAVAGDRTKRRFCLAMTLILLLLALGARTPLFHVLYRWAPGFNRFRGMSKFAVQATAFLVLLSGAGLDRLLRAEKVRPRLAAAPLLLAALLFGAGAGLAASAGPDAPAPWWGRLMLTVRDCHESYIYNNDPARYADPSFARQAQVHAGEALLWAGVPCAIAGACLLFFRSSRKLAICLAMLGMGEMLLFAWSLDQTFDLVRSPVSGLPASPAEYLKRFFAKNPGDYRILCPAESDYVMRAGGCDVWGLGPLPPGRYAQFVASTQGLAPDGTVTSLTFVLHRQVYKMLRWRYTLPSWGLVQVHEAMPHVALVREYAVLTKRDDILLALNLPAFDPARKVILETQPDPKPSASAEGGEAKVVDSGADYLVIEADTPAPAILLVTDGYAAGWRARPLPESIQSQYRVLPANWCLRAVPLQAGRHRILMEYMPQGYRIGKWISIGAIIGWLAALGWLAAKKRRPPGL